MILHFSDEVAPWHAWLDHMRKKKRGFRQALKPRTWTETRRLLEAQGATDTSGIPLSQDGGIAHVFQESADLCADLASNGPQSEGARYQDVPQQVRQLVERSALEIRAELQQLDSDYQSRFADAKRPEGLELLKQYCLERFDSCAQALLFTSVSSDAASINPLYEQCLGMAEEKTINFWTTVLQDFPPHAREDVMSWVNLKLSSRKLHWLADAARRHLKSHPAPVIDMQSIAGLHARGNLSKPEEATKLPELPPRFQTAFESEKARRELEYATRAERFPNQQQFGNDPLHVIVLIQSVFFAFCTQARNAHREGDWSIEQASHAIDHVWPFICDFYFVREHGSSSEDAKSSFRVALWRTITDDARWKQHLRDLAALAEGAEAPTPLATDVDGKKPRAANANDPQAKAEDETDSDANAGPEEHGSPRLTPPKRLTSMISSPTAARRLEAYLESKPLMDLTDFAIQSHTSDRTLRSFRKTGRVRRDIFEDIARAMGTTPEELLKPE